MRGPLIAELFSLYATGQYSLKALTVKAHALGLTHPRSGRRMMRAEIERIQIPCDIADWIAEGVRGTEGEAEQARQHALAHAVQRRRGVQAKLDRGYDDYLEGLISQAFWTRKSEEWEAEVSVRPTLRRSTSCHEVGKLGIGGVDGTRAASRGRPPARAA